MASTTIIIRIAATEEVLQVTPTSPDMRVSELKQALQAAHAFPVKKQKLSVNGKKLKDRQRLSEIALDPSEDVIDLSVSVKGGCVGCDCCGCFCCI